MESDAEWIDVDREFGVPGGGPTTRRPNPPRRPPPGPPPRPIPRSPVTERPHDAPERAPSSPSAPARTNVNAVVAGCVGGLLGVALVLLLVYMVVLRRRLSKAKTSGRASRYQLRVEDVAHLSNLDETTNTYVNTTDLQKLVSTVRAKGKSENRLPTPPRLLHQTPAAYRPAHVTTADNGTFQEDRVVVVRAPMPIPHKANGPFLPQPAVTPQPVSDELMYSNLEECAALSRPAPRKEAPKTAPPPLPTKEPMSPVTHPARPAPAPPKSSPPPQANDSPAAGLAQTARPVPPPAAHKPGKVALTVQARLGAKPTPPTPPKPGKGKGKALPPLKMVLRGAVKDKSSDMCTTPDTALTHLSPACTPTREGSPEVASISAKIALLEGHMRTVGGTGTRAGGIKP